MYARLQSFSSLKPCQFLTIKPSFRSASIQSTTDRTRLPPFFLSKKSLSLGCNSQCRGKDLLLLSCNCDFEYVCYSVHCLALQDTWEQISWVLHWKVVKLLSSLLVSQGSLVGIFWLQKSTWNGICSPFNLCIFAICEILIGLNIQGLGIETHQIFSRFSFSSFF